MNTGQMMLVIGAFMLFGVVRANFQRLEFESAHIMGSNGTMQTAVTIARSMIDEITQKPFDACFANNPTKTVFRLSDLTSCGSGAGEYYPNFNDVDDFHGKTFRSPASPTSTLTTVPRCLWGTEGYTVQVQVQYVSQTNPNVVSATPTWAKRITVTVTSAYSDFPLTMSHVVTY